MHIHEMRLFEKLKPAYRPPPLATFWEYIYPPPLSHMSTLDLLKLPPPSRGINLPTSSSRRLWLWWALRHSPRQLTREMCPPAWDPPYFRGAASASREGERTQRKINFWWSVAWDVTRWGGDDLELFWACLLPCQLWIIDSFQCVPNLCRPFFQEAHLRQPVSVAGWDRIVIADLLSHLLIWIFGIIFWAWVNAPLLFWRSYLILPLLADRKGQLAAKFAPPKVHKMS